MSATVAPTSWGKDYYELIKSGILKNMSFDSAQLKIHGKRLLKVILNGQSMNLNYLKFQL